MKDKEMPKLGEVIDSLLTLLWDAQAAEKLMEQTETPFARRTYVRAMFAYVEVAIWVIKRTCLLAAGKSPTANFTLAEQALLADAAYDLKSNGEPTTQTKFLRLPENLRFAIRISNRLFGARIEVRRGEKDWQSFMDAIRIRHRITHPKDLGAFDVSDDELKTCKEACHWFNDIVMAFIASAQPGRKRREGEGNGADSRDI
jgi:hypothetical protein